MKKKVFFEADEIPFGGADGKFLILIRKIIYMVGTKKQIPADYDYLLLKYREETTKECERLIYNSNPKTAYSYLVSTFNAINKEILNMLKLRNEENINSVLTETFYTCQDSTAYLVSLIIDHYPEKLKNPKLIEAALSLPKFSHHRIIAESYIESCNKTESNALTIDQYQLIFKALKKAKLIIQNADESIFLHICLNKSIPYEKRIKWTGARKACFAFMMDILNIDVSANEVNKYFQQWGSVKGIINSKDLARNDKTNAKHTNFIKNLLAG